MDWIKGLREQKYGPLPGENVQWQMAHAARKPLTPVSIPAEATRAAVMILLYPSKSGAWSIVLIQRITNKHDRHSGQISFPGGRMEPDDTGPSHAAARETEEEVGVSAGKIEIVGNLTDLYIPVSNYLVHPFIGIVDFTPEFYPQESEVAGILETPIDLLLSPETIKSSSIKISPDFTLHKVPYFDVHGHVVWGATAMIMNEFLWVMRKVKEKGV